MSGIDPDRVKHVWHEADDTGVARALAMRDDYVPEAYAIVVDEAHRRGIEAVKPGPHTPPDSGLTGVHVRGFLDFIQANTFFSGCVAGVCLRLGLIVMQPRAQVFHWVV